MTTNEYRPTGGQPAGGRGTKKTSGYSHYSTKAAPDGKLYSEDGRCIGWVYGSTLRKELDGSKHMMQKPRGWAMDACALETIKARGIAVIEIEDRETGLTHRASPAVFDKCGVRVNRGYGLQLCLPLKFWSVDGEPAADPPPSPPDPDEPCEPAAAQMSLW
jgi:hypothetical protein